MLAYTVLVLYSFKQTELEFFIVNSFILITNDNWLMVLVSKKTGTLHRLIKCTVIGDGEVYRVIRLNE